MIEHPGTELFDAGALMGAGGEHALAEGRGHAVFFDYQDKRLVLKHYLRGGSMAMLLGDRYIGSDCNRSRAFREWRLLRQMRFLNLPVPVPVAASCLIRGIFYRADLITRRIDNVTTLADHLLEAGLDKAVWQAIGACIRRFHDASIYHADLNARNILIGSDNDSVHLIDFDKGCVRHLGESWKASNLARLQRSLLKFKSLNAVFHYRVEDWDDLLGGYKRGGA